MPKLPLLLDLLGLCLLIYYTILAPYTKVEESFNIQAIHDLIYYKNSGNSTADFSFSEFQDQFDHFQFPGVVPRTFIGPVFISQIVKAFLKFVSLSKPTVLILSRLIIGLVNYLFHFLFVQSVQSKFGSTVSIIYRSLFISQFHLLYYMSRPLPNSFALGLVSLAFSAWLQDSLSLAFLILGFTATVFRSEIFALILPIALITLYQKKISLWKGILVGIFSIAFAILFSFFVDSYFWQRYVWPEGEVLLFNTLMNKSHEWGVQPFYWYFTSGLPRMLLLALPLALLGFFFSTVTVQRTKVSVFSYLFAAISFILLYSLLPHKEVRFIFYAIPLLNLSAAVATYAIVQKLNRRWLQTLFTIVLATGITFTLLFSLFYAQASSYNYFGANALNKLHSLVATSNSTTVPTVHMDAYATMNGVSRFIQQDQHFLYDKKDQQVKFEQFDYLLTGVPDKHNTTHEIIYTQNGFDHINWKQLQIITAPKVFIMKRKESKENERRKQVLQNSLQPLIKWAQRNERLLITIDIYNAKEEQFSIQGNTLYFEAKSDNKTYAFELQLYKPIESKDSVYKSGPGWVKLSISKRYQKEKFWPRLLAQEKSSQYGFIKRDWDNWYADDEYDDVPDSMQETTAGKDLKKSAAEMGVGYSHGHGIIDTWFRKHVLQSEKLGKTFSTLSRLKQQDFLRLLISIFTPEVFSMGVAVMCLNLLAILLILLRWEENGQQNGKSKSE